MNERDPILVLWGEWRFEDGGKWKFDVDKKQMGRCVNINACGATYKTLQNAVGAEFKQKNGESFVFSYCVPVGMSVLADDSVPPVSFCTDEGLTNFCALRKLNPRINLFVTCIEERQRSGLQYSTGETLTPRKIVNTISWGRTAGLGSETKKQRTADNPQQTPRKIGAVGNKEQFLGDKELVNCTPTPKRGLGGDLIMEPNRFVGEDMWNGRNIMQESGINIERPRKVKSKSRLFLVEEDGVIHSPSKIQQSEEISARRCLFPDDETEKLKASRRATNVDIDNQAEDEQKTKEKTDYVPIISLADDDEFLCFEDDEDTMRYDSESGMDPDEKTSCEDDSDCSSEYDYNHWTDLIDREYGEEANIEVNTIPSLNMEGQGRAQSDGCVRGSADSVVEGTSGGRTESKSADKRGSVDVQCSPQDPAGTYLALTLENVYADIRDGDGYYAVDAAPVFEEYLTQSTELCDVDVNSTEDAIYKGRVFKTKKDCQNTLAIYAIRRLFHFKQQRSTTKKVTFTCIDPRCEWYVYAARMKNSDYFQIRKANLGHQCDITSRSQYSKHATARIIAEMMKSKYNSAAEGPRARDIPEMMLKELHVTISYWKGWKSRELAVDITQGSAEGSYGLLPVYVHLLMKSNPGTVVELKKDVLEDGTWRFKYMFMCMRASMEGAKYVREVVVVDGTHLSGKYKGCLLTASMQDGNFQIFPFAFAVVDSENDNSWKWFLEKVKSVLPKMRNLYFVSDRHKSIKKGILEVFPTAGHGCCHVHLERNVSARYSKMGLSKLVGIAARVFRLGDFNELFGEIEKRSPECALYLKDLGFEHWTRVHCNGYRYNMMSSNIAESLNAVLERAKGFPIISMFEYIRAVMMRWFYMRQKVAIAHKSEVTPNVDKHLVKMLENSENFSATIVSDGKCELKTENGSRYYVDLATKTCSCRRFETLQLPCQHAIAASIHMSLPTTNGVGKHYSLSNFKQTYAGRIVPVPEPRDETIPLDISDIKMVPPKCKVQSGRRKKARIPSTGEYNADGTAKVSKNKCGRCRQSGHNRATCKSII